MGVFLIKIFGNMRNFSYFYYVKKIKIMKNYELTLKRTDMMQAGAYDGRFREKTVVDRKKKEKKEWARKKFTFDFKICK
jgi:hypothetical protein